ncbi:uncharacterized protein F4822DRAFT_444343 [Hypoxylon trugodes]|uniref:uncharacterized protein n=1 Tax=Hypoxylon trugodes TaxID=326681 RepID=UPI00219E06EE|nr:uncharacterized protein F4822DRAFT_444343 [Hypoxylon trugodes]KAI1387765.1 hypothetical protein F4822DRAFT_444343 [Hypoxylon trugodes]
MVTPKPDLTVGYSYDKITPIRNIAWLYHRKQDFVINNAQIYFPYFLVEVKTPKGDVTEALNRLMGDGATCLRLSSQVLPRTMNFVFGTVATPQWIQLYSIWQDKSGQIYVELIEDFSLSKVETYSNCRDAIRKIHEWAAQVRLPAIFEGLYQMVKAEEEKVQNRNEEY